MKSLSYKRIYKSQEYLATLGTIEYRSLFGSYSLTVDDTVFAMVSDGELYLRACEQSAQYCVKHPPVWLTYKKCGRSVTLNYYRVDESLWRNQLKLVRLSKYSLDAALKEKSTRNTRERLKDLPNMSFHLEAILGEVGIKDVRALRILGAKMCWLRLRQQNSLVTEKILFMLEVPLSAFMKLRSRWHAARSLQNGLTLLRRNRSFLRNLSNLALQTTNLRQ
ncbi:putative DNA transformation protein with TfoX domain [Escherichia coli]|uniref:Putative DNA transformation protein with TfoX domain n=8 Tax=root TaxID=1 RepID=A0A376UC37_ECOLX|nr:putative DNA transformation protein with TfoX domain [Escherichia coli]